jgi:hypothetical protein
VVVAGAAAAVKCLLRHRRAEADHTGKSAGFLALANRKTVVQRNLGGFIQKCLIGRRQGQSLLS